VLFQSSLLVKGGSLSGSFKLNKVQTNVRLSAQSFDAQGKFGYFNTYFTVLPVLSVSFSSTPDFMTVGDTLTIPV
jgi:hypothetical protein